MRQCPDTGGSEVLDKIECKEACNTLGIPISGYKFKDGKPCYKAPNGKCKQNGGFNQRSSVICKKEGNFKMKWSIFSGISKILPCPLQFRLQQFHISDPCLKNPCGTNANCSVSESGERECSCPDDFPKGNPIHKCHGKLPFES